VVAAARRSCSVAGVSVSSAEALDFVTGVYLVND
jgi:hypothetical protein